MARPPRIEDLYEVPPLEIEMIGGYFDGRRMHVPDHRDEWLMPVPIGVTLHPEPDVTGPAMDIQRYRWTGSIRDDGTRVFQAVA
jgi:hypothetical protein